MMVNLYLLTRIRHCCCRYSLAIRILQLVLMMFEIDMLRCVYVSQTEVYNNASISRRELRTAGEWLPSQITPTVFNTNSVRIRFDVADPSLNIDRYRVVINSSVYRLPPKDVFSEESIYHNATGMYICEEEFTNLKEGSYSVKVIVKPTKVTVCGYNPCRQSGYKDFSIHEHFTIPDVTSYPPTSAPNTINDIINLTASITSSPNTINDIINLTASITSKTGPGTSSASPTQTIRPSIDSQRLNRDADKASWRVGVIVGPVACVGLLSAGAYCIRSLKKRRRASVAEIKEGVELQQLRNNRTNNGVDVLPINQIPDHTEFLKRPLGTDLSQELTWQHSSPVIVHAPTGIPYPQVNNHLQDMSAVASHQEVWQGLYPKTPSIQPQPTHMPQFLDAEVHRVHQQHGSGDMGDMVVGGAVGGACSSCGTTISQFQSQPNWTTQCPHADALSTSGGYVEIGGLDGWRGNGLGDGCDQHGGILSSQEVSYLQSQSHLDLFSKLMAYPSRYSVASSQFTEMCEYINNSSAQPSRQEDRISPSLFHNPRQGSHGPNHLPCNGHILAPQLSSGLVWRQEVIMRSCPSLSEATTTLTEI